MWKQRMARITRTDKEERKRERILCFAQRRRDAGLGQGIWWGKPHPTCSDLCASAPLREVVLVAAEGRAGSLVQFVVQNRLVAAVRRFGETKPNVGKRGYLGGRVGRGYRGNDCAKRTQFGAGGRQRPPGHDDAKQTQFWTRKNEGQVVCTKEVMVNATCNRLRKNKAKRGQGGVFGEQSQDGGTADNRVKQSQFPALPGGTGAMATGPEGQNAPNEANSRRSPVGRGPGTGAKAPNEPNWAEADTAEVGPSSC